MILIIAIIISAHIFCNIRPDRYILIRSALFVQERNNRGLYPIISPVFGSIFNISMPYGPRHNRVPHFLKKLFGVEAGIDQSMRVSNEFFCTILGNFTELMVHIRDHPILICNGNNGGFIQGKLCLKENS